MVVFIEGIKAEEEKREKKESSNLNTVEESPYGKKPTYRYCGSSYAYPQQIHAGSFFFKHLNNASKDISFLHALVLVFHVIPYPSSSQSPQSSHFICNTRIKGGVHWSCAS
jgi:hypothetical protein